MGILALLSAVSTLSCSALKAWTLAEAWRVPLAFIAFFAAYFALYWLALGALALTVPMRREYDSPSPFYRALLDSGYRMLCSAGRVKLRVTGLEKLPKGTRFLLVSNHLSRFDPMVQSAVLHGEPLAFISKPSNFKIPIGRHYMRRCCYLSIDRENPRNALRTIERAASLMAEGSCSIGVYPEGHRGDGEALQPFRAGCLKAAIKSGCPIVVATIDGTQNIHRNFPLRSTSVRFDVLEVIYPAGERTTALAERIRGIMQSNLEQNRKDIPL